MADALVQVLGSPILNALVVLHVELWEDIKSTGKDRPYMDFLCQLAHNNPRQPYSWQDGLVFYKTWVVVSSNTPLIHQLLKEFHDTRMGGHLGVLRIFKRLA